MSDPSPVFPKNHISAESAPVINLPPASVTVAVSVTVSPIDVRVVVSGDIETRLATCATVTVAVALTEPDVAVIVAVPSATEVTSPVGDTVATDELDVAHVTAAPFIV